ncbi:MAG: antibiotic biosynthesis monooxygenase [Bacteroidetes bacterium]|nr:antibiotic biosynthesis monooxygenase [Bacteroidota bacterium]
MITRIVKMTFMSEHTAEFEKVFAEVSPNISKFKGCTGLQLFKDLKDPGVYFTFSTWEHEEDLETYRQSSLFRDTWQKTKPLFAARAEAWSVQNMLK